MKLICWCLSKLNNEPCVNIHYPENLICLLCSAERFHLVGLCPGIPASVTLEDLRETVQRTRRQHDWWQLAVLIDTAQLLNPFCAGSFSVSTSESSIRLPALRRNSESVKGLNLNTFKLYTGAALSVPPSPPGIPSLRPEPNKMRLSFSELIHTVGFFLTCWSVNPDLQRRSPALCSPRKHSLTTKPPQGR